MQYVRVAYLTYTKLIIIITTNMSKINADLHEDDLCYSCAGNFVFYEI
jgi:hypothetical protein